jgi:hypothetical protein
MADAAPLPRRFAFRLVFACFLGALLFTGCGKPADAPKNQTKATTNSAPPPEVAGPGPNEKVCFACNGQGTVPCPVPGCKNGQVDCPGPCLKLSKGIWRHTDIDGKPSDVLWQVFNSPDGRETFAVSEYHLGEVFAIQDGQLKDLGKCKICGGTGKVTCSVCKGTGRVICPICNGQKFIPIAWTPTDNPWFDSQPDVIRLADGRVILGRVAASLGDDRTIITRDKKVLHVKASDILPKAQTNSPAAQTSPAI